MKLLAYKVNGSTYNPDDGTTENWTKIIGIELQAYEDAVLEGNPAFIAVGDEDEVPSNYEDVSSIINWGSFGVNAAEHFVIREELKKLQTGEENEQELAILEEYNLLSYFKIYDFMANLASLSMNISPVDMDYDILGLHKKKTFVKGDLIQVEYYGSYDGENSTFTNLIVKEVRVYERRDTYLFKRSMTITWYMNDGSVGFTKNTDKFYNILDSGKYGITRRNNIFEEIKIVVVGLIMYTEQLGREAAENLGKEYMATIAGDMGLYINGAENQLISKLIAEDGYPFLDNAIGMDGTSGNPYTIRDYIQDELTIDYTKSYTLADKSPFGLSF